MLNLTSFFKFIGLIPRFTIFSFGGGSGSSTTTPTLTPEQADLLKTQTEAYKSTFLPSYQKATGGAQNVYDMSSPYLNKGALQGFNTSLGTANQLNQPSLNAIGTSAETLKNIIDPNYIKNQLAAATQPIQEQTRDLRTQQTAMFGGSGNLGSSRAALVDANLASLDKQRQSQAVAAAISNITGQQISAAGNLGTMGFQGVNAALGNNQAAVNFSNAPTDLYSKYASILYGTPQSATPNFTGTIGSNTSGSGSKFGFSYGS